MTDVPAHQPVTNAQAQADTPVGQTPAQALMPRETPSNTVSLRWKIIFVVLSVFVMLLAVLRFMDNAVFSRTFAELERREAGLALRRCTSMVDADFERLETLAAAHDATAAHDRSSAAGFVAFADADGRGVHLAPDGASVAGPSALELETALQAWAQKLDDARVQRGVILSGGAGAIVAAARRRPPESGWVLAGRWVDRAYQESLSQRAFVGATATAQVVAAEDVDLPPAAHAALTRLTTPGAAYIDTAPVHEVNAYSVQRDARSGAMLLVHVRAPRGVTAAGWAAMRFSESSLVAVAILCSVVLGWLLNRIVVRPLGLLRDHVRAQAQRGDACGPIELRRRDEFGELASEFNRMTQRLEESRSRALDMAHRAGMADVATSVLHDVGNVLNSLQVSTDVLCSSAERSSLSGLGRAVGLLEQHAGAVGEFLARDERGRRLPEYLKRLTAVLESEHESLVGELRSVRESVKHLQDIVAMQQTLAAAPGYRTRESIERLVADVLELQRSALRRLGVAVHVDIERGLPELPVSRPQLLRVLENLVRNAAEATQVVAEGQRAVLVAARRSADERSVVISVSDNGVGFEPETRERVFSYGFTTKEAGHGFGLHFCANAVSSLGGRIEAISDGPGCGAEFRVELPLAGEEAAA